MSNYTMRDIVDLVWSKRASLIKFCGAVFILVALITLFIPNKYKATTTFYAASDDLSRPDVMFGISRDRSYFFGGNNERDRIISVSQSSQLLDLLLEKHALYSHYGIDSTSEKSRQKLQKEFNKNFEVIHNDLDALELSIIDKDPEMAAALANDARIALGTLVSGMIKSSQDNFIQSLKTKINTTELTIAEVNDSIREIRQQYQLYDSDNQIAQLAEIVTQSKNRLESEMAKFDMYENLPGVRRDTLNNIRARISGLKNQIKAIENPDSVNSRGLNIYELNKVKPILQMLEGQYYTLKGEWARDEVQLGILEVAKEAPSQSLHLVDSAGVPSEKFSPHRSILVLGSVLAAALFYLLGILLMEAYKETSG